MRSSPQFGCTLAAYEFLQRLMPMPGHELKVEKTGTVEERTASAPMQYLRSRNALKIILVYSLGVTVWLTFRIWMRILRLDI